MVLTEVTSTADEGNGTTVHQHWGPNGHRKCFLVGYSLKKLNLMETDFFTKQIAQKFLEPIEVLVLRSERGGGNLERSRMEASVRTQGSELFRARLALVNAEQTLLVQRQLELLSK